MILFDPLSIIIKLGILSKKPIGTKISSQNFIIEIQEAGIYQSIYRYINNDNGYDVQNILEPIVIVCQYYLNFNKIEINSNIKKLFVYALDGIEKLLKIYRINLIVYYNLKFIELIILSYIKLVDNKFEYTSLTRDSEGIKSISHNSLNNIDTNKILIKSSSSTNLLNGISSIITHTMSPLLIRYGATGFFMFDESDFLLDSDTESIYDIDKNETIFQRGISEDSLHKNLKLNNNDIYLPSSPQLLSKKNSFQILQNDNSSDNYNIDFIKNCMRNNYPTILLSNFNKYWTNEKINNIILIFDFYFNSQLKIYKNEIEDYMKIVDNDITNIILDYYANRLSL